MAKNEEEGKKEKKGGMSSGIKSVLMFILVPILIVVVIAAMFFSIMDAITQLILGATGVILNTTVDLLTNPQKTLSAWGGSITNWFDRELGWGDEFDKDAYEDKRKNFNPTVEISQEIFEEMRDNLDNAINREAKGVGLDDVMLKKMLLSYKRGIYFKDTNIIIELTEEELNFISENGEESIKPFTLVEGDQDSAFGEDGKKYLNAKGMIDVKLYGTNTDLIFYPLDTLKEIYEKEYLQSLNNNKKEYAESVLKYLEKCYTYSNSGIQMYAKTIDSKDVTWNYENIGKDIKLNDSYTDTRVDLITIDYIEKILQYATPVEFMVNLMELTGSKEFINTFIEAVGTQNYIKMDLCDLTYTDTYTQIYELDRETDITGKKVGLEYTIQRADGTTEGLIITQQPTIEEDFVNIIVEDINARSQNIGSNISITAKVSETQIDSFSVTLDSANNWKYTFRNFIEPSLEEKVKSDSSKVIYTEKAIHKEVKYDLLLKEVETWYTKITQNNEEKINTIYTTINEEDVEVQIASENLAIKIPQNDESITYTSNANSELFGYDLINQASPDWEQMLVKGLTQEECLKVQFSHIATLPENGYDYRDYLYETMVCKDTNRTKSTLKTINEKTYIEGTPTITDNTDMFLALLSGSDSRYEIGDSFVSKADGGKVVMYLDLYEGIKEKTVTLKDGTEITSKFGIVGVGELLENGADMFFDILERSSNTRGLTDIMKYIMYRYSGNDYGVTEFSFEIFDPDLFISQGKSGTSLLTKYLHKVEGTEDVLVNADDTKYIIYKHEDGSLKVGYGIDIVGGGYESLFQQAGYSVQEGTEVEKEFVDELEEQEISDIVNEVREKTKNLDLKEYQIHALVARARDCGMVEALGSKNGKTFEQAYNEYWNQERDDLFEAKANSANFSHDLNIKYMNMPTNTEGGASRRRSEWTLFQTGYYKEIDSWYPDSGEILDMCVEVMNDMLAHNVSYYSNLNQLVWNNIEESGNFSNPNRAVCCSTYASLVLYRAGIFTEEFMNRFNYNSPEGLDQLFEAAGWIRVSEAEAQPGDVCNFTRDANFRHTFIYAGGNEIWDQASGSKGTDGTPALRRNKKLLGLLY